MDVLAQVRALKMRQAEKEAARRRDAVRIEEGASPAEIQHQNSMFSRQRIRNARIHNLAEIVGK